MKTKKSEEEWQIIYQRRQTAVCMLGKVLQDVLANVLCKILKSLRNWKYKYPEKQEWGRNWKQSLFEKSVEGAMRSQAFLCLPASSEAATSPNPAQKYTEPESILSAWDIAQRRVGMGFHIESREVWILSTEAPFPSLSYLHPLPPAPWHPGQEITWAKYKIPFSGENEAPREKTWRYWHLAGSSDLPTVKPVSHKPHPTQSTFCNLFIKYEH